MEIRQNTRVKDRIQIDWSSFFISKFNIRAEKRGIKSDLLLLGFHCANP